MTLRTKKLSAWQLEALQDLRAIADRFPDDILLRARPVGPDNGYVRVPIRLNTSDVTYAPGGLRLGNHEDLVLWIGPSQLLPPLVQVQHERFVGFPHVLHGQQLCIYLDPTREWNPRLGVGGALDRLHDWLVKAAANKFDSTNALFHAVGGIPSGSRGRPTVVVRGIDQVNGSRVGYLTVRTDDRMDLHLERSSPAQIQVPVLDLPMPLPLGVGRTLGEVLSRLDNPLAGSKAQWRSEAPPQSAGFLIALAASAIRATHGSPQMFVFDVPHPDDGFSYLLAGRIPSGLADNLRQQVRHRQGFLIDIPIDSVPADTPMEWCPVSDERSMVTTRRDDGRPVNGFHNKAVQIWGCGGIGSWIAEFVARAGARHLTLCDPDTVTGGVLVRQNFTELNVGKNKAKALAERILAIRDDITVETFTGAVPTALDRKFATDDVVIDATVSNGIGQLLDDVAVTAVRPLLAQVATDVKTGTLGLLTVSAQGTTAGPYAIDLKIGEAVKADGLLEAFHPFWTEVAPEDELVPAPGCSVPTFHGSAADLAAVAASLTTLLGSHLSGSLTVSGTHLVALAHSPVGPAHHFLLADKDGALTPQQR